MQIDNSIEGLRKASGAHIGTQDRTTDRQRINRWRVRLNLRRAILDQASRVAGAPGRNARVPAAANGVHWHRDPP